MGFQCYGKRFADSQMHDTIQIFAKFHNDIESTFNLTLTLTYLNLVGHKELGCVETHEEVNQDHGDNADHDGEVRDNRAHLLIN